MTTPTPAERVAYIRERLPQMRTALASWPGFRDNYEWLLSEVDRLTAELGEVGVAMADAVDGMAAMLGYLPDYDHLERGRAALARWPWAYERWATEQQSRTKEETDAG